VQCNQHHLKGAKYGTDYSNTPMDGAAFTWAADHGNPILSACRSELNSYSASRKRYAYNPASTFWEYAVATGCDNRPNESLTHIHGGRYNARSQRKMLWAIVAQ
jgi:hypothetical protein